MDKLLDMAREAGSEFFKGSCGYVSKNCVMSPVELRRYTELVIRDILEEKRPELTSMEVDCIIERYFNEEDEVFDD